MTTERAVRASRWFLGPTTARRAAAWAGLGLAMALVGQWRADVARSAWTDPIIFFSVAILAWCAALKADRASLSGAPPGAVPGPILEGRRVLALAAAVALVLVAGLLWPAVAGGGGLGFLAYPDGPSRGGNELTLLGLIEWIAAIALYMAALCEIPHIRIPSGARVHDGRIQMAVPLIGLAVLGIMLVAAWFRITDLSGVPLEMTSDHTEKLTDVTSVLDGLRPVFFYGNAGREPLQFYWTAFLIRLGLPNTFHTLKLGMAAVSVATIPIVYLLGRRIAGPLAGLMAALALALAPWHIQITRIGLRIAWSPFFVALVLVLLLRALDSGRRNDWLLAGLAAGAGVYGYTGFRPMALVIPIVLILRVFYLWRAGGMPRSAWGILGRHALAAAGAALVVLAPLLRYAADRPDFFWVRTLSRVTDAETAIPGPVRDVFVSNWRNALLMFNWTSDSAWFQSPTGRPALETVGGALVVLGALTAVHRALRGDWRSAAILAAIPVLLSSSALSLAFPIENPSLSRAAGTVIPVVILVGLALDFLRRRLSEAGGSTGTIAFFALTAGLFVAMDRNTATRYFVEYRALYNQSTHPTIQYAEVIRTFENLGGDLDHAYLVGWAHGPDFRAIGKLAGDLEWGGLLWRAAGDGSDAVLAADAHASDPVRKLYLVGGPQSLSNIEHLESLYPGAVVTEHRTEVPSQGFWSVFVPGKAAP